MRQMTPLLLFLSLALTQACDSGSAGGGATEADTTAPDEDIYDTASDAPLVEDVSPDLAEDSTPELVEDIPEETPCEPLCGGCEIDDGCGGSCPADPPCDDGDPCTLDDQCMDGACQGEPRDCQDASLCTVDSCDPQTGDCVHDMAAADGLECDDGNPCTGDDACLSGTCAGALLPPDQLTTEDCLCDGEDADCAPLEDGDLCNGTLQCADDGEAEGTCQVDPDSIPICEDGLDCTTDGCDPSTGCTVVPVDAACDDANLCTDDVCDPGVGCTNDPVDDGTACAPPGWECMAGDCVCVPQCDGKDCGDDGCGGTCGACGCGEICDAGACEFTACDGKDCGDDGCGGTCGTCGCGEVCDAGACDFTACDGMDCGDDGCGGSCGDCPDGQDCDAGLCVDTGEACPPPGPYGTGIGDVAADATVTDCDGVEYSIHDLCNYQATWIFVFAGW